MGLTRLTVIIQRFKLYLNHKFRCSFFIVCHINSPESMINIEYYIGELKILIVIISFHIIFSLILVHIV